MKRIAKLLSILTTAVVCIVSVPFSTSAESTTQDKVGIVLEFADDHDYVYSRNFLIGNTSNQRTLGKLSISGDYKLGDLKDDFISYIVEEEQNLSFNYTFDKSYLTADKMNWHIIDDSAKEIDGIELENKVNSGSVILLTSLDHENWFLKDEYCDILKSSDEDSLSRSFSTNEVELSNGCFYRIIVSYKLERYIDDTNFLFWDTSDTEEKRVSEVYEFYASYKDIDTTPTGEKYYFYAGGKNTAYTVKTNSNNYAGSETIEKKDPHYGWDLGRFCLIGYTDKGDSDDVYLKKVGNKVKLTFLLDQDITRLNGNSDLFIERDKNGSDEEFKIAEHDMKHGELIIRHTDSENNTKEVKYSDYLAALSSPGVDKSVQLFEEGDYEVHLDYAITDTDGWDTTTYYKTSFNFKIRNANCMVYIFDSLTDSELSNGDVTENGFSINAAMSSYPKIKVKKEILNNTQSGLIEDTRFNGAASDGEVFTEEGIYTIKAYNRFDDKLDPAVKTIYVGNNNILTAYTKNLNKSNPYTIEQVKQMIDEGYTFKEDGTFDPPIKDDGTIIDPSPKESEPEISSLEENDTDSVVEAATETSLNETDNNSVVSDNSVEESEKKLDFPIVPVAAGAGGVLLIVLIGAVFRKTKGGKKNE